MITSLAGIVRQPRTPAGGRLSHKGHCYRYCSSRGNESAAHRFCFKVFQPSGSRMPVDARVDQAEQGRRADVCLCASHQYLKTLPGTRNRWREGEYVRTLFLSLCPASTGEMCCSILPAPSIPKRGSGKELGSGRHVERTQLS